MCGVHLNDQFTLLPISGVTGLASPAVPDSADHNAAFLNRMLGIAFNHQSNGRAILPSRSWNRVILHAGFERGKWVVMLRPWLLLPDADEENPAVTDNIGIAVSLVDWL
jgi:outer membrane phospholipase A